MKVFTFYSFKGGVGRTAMLMHLAVRWADRGKVVAVVDMDLNAPGVSYSPRLQKHPDTALENLGSSDLLATFYEMRDREKDTFGFFPPSKLLREMDADDKGGKWKSKGRLLVLPAGKTTLPQKKNYQDVEEHKIPQQDGGENEDSESRALRAFSKMFLKDLREFTPKGAEKPIDYLLIDCRTGYPDLVDMTIGYMADRVVLVSGLNHQNLHGLELTLKSLRPERIQPGSFSKQTLVAFSPVPIHVHDQAEAMAAMKRGVQIINDSCLSLEGATKVESPPRIYSIPYTPHLAITDVPIKQELVLGKSHPYWDVINKIADDLVPETASSPEEILAGFQRQAERITGFNLVQEVKELDMKRSENLEKPDIPVSDEIFISPFLWLPSWGWPFAGDKKKIAACYKKLPVNKELKNLREQLLNGLSNSISHSPYAKKKIMDNWEELSQFKMESLVEVFHEEGRKIADLDTIHIDNLFPILFKNQCNWAQLLLGNEQGLVAMLLQPFNGRGVFWAWDGNYKYWQFLVDALLENNLYMQFSSVLRDKIDSTELHPWGRLAILERQSDASVEQVQAILDAVIARQLDKDSAGYKFLLGMLKDLRQS
jgi:MinD-like ATPase involved in chromosome partitioning or flagellar assembly